MRLFPKREIERLVNAGVYDNYKDDPVGFGEKILGETFTDDVCRMMESVRDNPITIAKSANATGKTHAAARVAVWFYKVFRDSQVYTAAAPPERNLKQLLWGEIGIIIEKQKKRFWSDRLGTLNVGRNAKSFLTGLTIPTSGSEQQREAKFSGKHAPHMLFILDEGDAIPDEVYRGIESCASGGHVRVLIMFNPRGETGEVYRMEKEQRANVVHLTAFNHPNVKTGLDEIPGAVTREVTVRRINEWTRPVVDGEKIDQTCFDLPEFLEGETALRQDGRIHYPPLLPGKYKIEEPCFSYMVLGEYPAAGAGQLIRREWIDAARSRYDAYIAEFGLVPPEGVNPIMGLDIAEQGNDYNAACFRYGGFIPPILTWTGLDIPETIDRGFELHQQKSVKHIQVDGTGVGAGVAPGLRRMKCAATSVKVASSPTESTEIGEFKILRDQLWWSVREWLRTDQGAMLPPDKELIEELACPTYEVKAGKIEIMKKENMRKQLKRSPDKADALCLTFNKSRGVFVA